MWRPCDRHRRQQAGPPGDSPNSMHNILYEREHRPLCSCYARHLGHVPLEFSSVFPPWASRRFPGVDAKNKEMGQDLEFQHRHVQAPFLIRVDYRGC